MKCTCAIHAVDPGDYESWQLFEDPKRTARKPHRCNECYRTIQPGEQYENVKGLADGVWFKHKTCADCLSVRSVFFESYYYERLWDHVRDFLYECQHQVPEDCMVELTPAARAKVCELIEEYWEDE
jgi:hypothetical protein